ncbi:DUF2842 domain-containing protein [Neomegalonema sp.]|uniref:DUF2842 domain-containing protein n=1 Tax=Neomegalonema sp. TaxID=2039713 RepID=UPI002638830B|nr:DUF2842 domain-containing protein [Neomegalonema sp.]MDD2869377.1 DUF2842 domain-containing protein [Neomegalonema sp.]
MTRRWRIFAGSILMMVYIAAYSLIAALVVGAWDRPSLWAELALYVCLGLVWILPLKPLFKWMGRGAPDL